MHSINLSVIQSVCEWLEKGDMVWYASIVQTWGASPRPAGSLFAYSPKRDQVAGSLSGGCIEQDLIDELKIIEPINYPRIKRYGVNEDEVRRFQLPCGGQIELVLECLTPSLDCASHFKAIEAKLSKRQRVKRYLSMSAGEMSLSSDESASVSELSQSEKNIWLADGMMAHILGPEYRLLIVGVGEVTRYLIPMALAVEFSVTVCDSRADFIERSPILDDDIEVIKCLPDDLVREQFNDSHSAIVALAHDPRVDDLAIMEALTTDAFFIGAMGSLKTTENRIKRLTSLGIKSEQLAKLHAPIGLPIQSKTPPEIAISIISHLIEQRYIHNSAA